jgi:hypothetical protein
MKTCINKEGWNPMKASSTKKKPNTTESLYDKDDKVAS